MCCPGSAEAVRPLERLALRVVRDLQVRETISYFLAATRFFFFAGSFGRVLPNEP